MRVIIYFICLFILLNSCKEEIKEEVEGKPTSASTTIIKEEKGSISKVIDIPFKYFEDRSAKADSLKKIKLDTYYNNMKNSYGEYFLVSKWFQSDPPELKGVDGNHYKILKGVIKEGQTITRKDFINESETGTYKYFFESEDQYVILDLSVIKNDVKCVNFRRILKGFGNEPMHDFVFNDKGEVMKEIYQCDVNPSLYEEDGNLYFEFEKELNDKEITNTINLGEYLDI